MPEIIKNLWLCSWSEAQDTCLNDVLVINCTNDLKNISKNSIRIPIDDHLKEKDTLKLNEVIFDVLKKIDNHLKSNLPVIVHCLAGRQRSATVVVSYLMVYHNLTLDNAVDFVKLKKRDIFFPSTNFIETLYFVNQFKDTHLN